MLDPSADADGTDLTASADLLFSIPVLHFANLDDEKAEDASIGFLVCGTDLKKKLACSALNPL